MHDILVFVYKLVLYSISGIRIGNLLKKYIVPVHSQKPIFNLRGTVLNCILQILKFLIGIDRDFTSLFLAIGL